MSDEDDLVLKAKEHLTYLREKENVFIVNLYTLELLEKLIKKIEQLHKL